MDWLPGDESPGYSPLPFQGKNSLIFNNTHTCHGGGTGVSLPGVETPGSSPALLRSGKFGANRRQSSPVFAILLKFSGANRVTDLSPSRYNRRHQDSAAPGVSVPAWPPPARANFSPHRSRRITVRAFRENLINQNRFSGIPAKKESLRFLRCTAVNLDMVP